MSQDLNSTPRSNRLHIAFYGRRNSGKSSLLNSLVGQEVSIVSPVAGTTTDPVQKSIEINGLGPCVFIDTAGFDDIDSLGDLRVKKTKEVLEKTDIALLLFSETDIEKELLWWRTFKEKDIPCLAVISKGDLIPDLPKLVTLLKEKLSVDPVVTSAIKRTGLKELKEELLKALPDEYEKTSIVGSLAAEKDLVLCVMPQNIQAPKGRLILAQVQTIRDLLDKKCIVVCVTTDLLKDALNSLKEPPHLIITDSQAFKEVSLLKPKESILTSFSILFAAYKGDIEYYKAGVAVLDSLTQQDRVLIAECCTHAPLSEDIGREKIPALLRKKIGPDLMIDIVSGNDYPQDLTQYALIIQCGGCMFTRRHILARIDRAKDQRVPMTNYGLVLAHLLGLQN